MGKTVAMFPGQGSQFVGMAHDLFDADERVRERYDQAKKILGFDIAEISFTGPQELLVQTMYTQPAIFMHSCMLYDIAVRRGFAPDFCAGHSLGEYTALYAAGVLSFEDALLAVGKRAEFMQEACEREPGTMAAVLNLSFDVVQEVCNLVDGVVEPANHNSRDQIVISGDEEAIEEAAVRLKKRGARRIIPLSVGGAFHSPLMEPAPEQLAEVLDTLEFRPAAIPVVPNVTAVAVSDPQELKDLLIQQITAPVLWYPTLQWLAENGVDRFVEVGPKQVLAGLARKSVKDGEVFNIEDSESIDAFQALSRDAIADKSV